MDDSDPTALSEQEFLRTYLAHQQPLFRFILTFVPKFEDAEDLFQQTSVTLWSKRTEFDGVRDYGPWARGIAYNHIRNHWRNAAEGLVLLGDDLLEQLAARYESRNERWRGLEAALERCLGKLPSAHRELIERCYRDRGEVGRIATERARSSDSIYRLLRRIRGGLSECVNRELSASEA